MSARLSFLRRSAYDISTFGGDVFFDINGKNVGKLSDVDCYVDVPAGTYVIRMYKSHFNTMIGFAEATVTVYDGNDVMVRYCMPSTVGAPGNILLSNYSVQSANEIIANVDKQYAQQIRADIEKREKTDSSNRKAIGWIIAGIVSASVLPFLIWALLEMLWIL